MANSLEDNRDVITQMKKINSRLDKLDEKLNTFNKKLENVLVKNDGSLQGAIKECLMEIKEDLLKSVIKSVEILEGRLFEKDQELEKLKAQTKTLDTELTSQKDKHEKVLQELKKVDEKRQKYENESEQYSRANNIKLRGIEDTNLKETSRESAEKVIKTLRENNICNISMADIDIAHRLPNKNNQNRDIIVRLRSRQTKSDILSNRKKLKGKDIFINDDLTKLNLHVLMCVKKKMTDEISDAWYSNGKIIYKNHMDKTDIVKFEEFEHWISLPWPNSSTHRA